MSSDGRVKNGGTTASSSVVLMLSSPACNGIAVNGRFQQIPLIASCDKAEGALMRTRGYVSGLKRTLSQHWPRTRR